MGRRNQATEGPRLTAAEKKARAFELRKAGATYAVIAEKVGYNDKSAARKAVEGELNRVIGEPAKEALQLELERLDTMNRAIWPKVLKGDLKAIETGLKISERRSKYQGLDDYERRMAEVEERRIALEEAQALMVAQALANVLNSLNLSPEQREKAPELVDHEMKQLTGENDAQ